MTKKITAILLSFIMVLTFMPIIAFADPVPTLEPIGPVDFTQSPVATADAYVWTSADAKHTLTLNGGTIDGTISDDATFAIKVPENTTIIVSGDSKILASISGDAIVAEGKLTIRRNGNAGDKLTVGVSGDGTQTASGDAYGIRAFGDITIEDIILSVDAGKATKKSAGIYSSGNITINNANGGVVATGGDVSADSSGCVESFGIYSGGNLILKKGDVTANAGIATGLSEDGVYYAGSYGLSAKNCTVNGGKLYAKSSEISGDSTAINIENSVDNKSSLKITSGIVKAEGTWAIYSGIIEIIGGTVNASSDARAISAEDKFDIKDGTVNATSKEDDALYATTLNISGGTVNATSKEDDALYATGINITGGVIKAVSMAEAQYSIHSAYMFNVSGGTVNAIATGDAEALFSGHEMKLTDGTINVTVATCDAIAAKAGTTLTVGSSIKTATLTNARYKKANDEWQNITTSTGNIPNNQLKPQNGKNTIKITFSGGSQDTISVTTGDGDKGSTGGNVSGDALTMTYGQVYYIKATGSGLKYESDKTSVVTVGQTDGKVTAVGAGSANITITDSAGKKKVLKVTVNPKALNSSMLSAISDQEYTGSDINPAVTVKDGAKTLVKDTDYTLTYTNNREIASKTALKSPTVIVTGKGNYTGSLSTKFNITFKVEIPNTATGKPNFDIVVGGKKLVEGTDYTVTYKDNNKIGYATATITGRGIYAGINKTVTFKVIPKKSAVNKFTVGKKSVTLKWKKVNGVDGYWLRLSTNKDFSNFKKVKVSNPNALKKVVKGLKTGKRYYVKVRGYKNVLNGSIVEPFYGKWSAAKRTAKIK